ncbi:cytoplasmic polyadenylation element-binding protein [Drosophila albomicans]|uniref:Cytoplasmic polyadenylation element-binding protein n=1 Tax=Drosophila albomicans TaxID=7291 RepID=A0A6P8XQN4_DROAB|nr:cytoplasmic polyadenylation element-binding protein [Drosophila albomicans]
MSFNWPTFVLTLLFVSGCEAQLFAQPSNVVYTTYLQRVGGGSGATQLPNHVTVQRGQTQIIKPAQLHEIMDGEALELAPLLQQLLSQTVPNWQQSQQQELQQQQQQQQQQTQQQQPLHFFVYENSQPVRLTSQQPQILPGFNGVNVQQQQQPQSTSMPIQLQQQQPQQQQYIETAPKSVAAIRPIAGGVFVAPTATLAHGIQPTISSQAQNAPEATSCKRCCPEDVEAAATPCPCCQVSIPLLSAAALKATVG